MGTIVWSPLARAWGDGTARSEADPFADMLYAEIASDRATIDAIGAVAAARGVSRALAWLRTNPVVVAQLVGASRMSRIDDAVAPPSLDLTADEVRALEESYTPRHDFQGISDEREMARIPGCTA